MNNKKNKIILCIIVLLIGFAVYKIGSNIVNNNSFVKTRNSYEEIVNEISVEDIANDTYITSISVEADFNLKDNYNQYDSQYDMINITVNLSNDFEAMGINERCSELRKIDEEIVNILSAGKDSTGYSELLEDYAPYKGSNIQVDEDLDIEFVSSFQKYTFYSGYHHSQDAIYIQENEKYGYTEYDLEWNGDTLTSIKQHESGNSGTYHSSESTESSYVGSYDATLEYGSGSVLIAVSKDAMDRYLTAINNDNQGTIDEMKNSGEIGWTEKGTKCNIVDRGIGIYQVKLLDGIYAGNTVYVVSESVNEK